MLTFKRLRAENFCQHRKLEVEFTSGVIGVIGRNGSGKSNLIKAIFRALTGKSLNPGKKEEDVAWGAEGGSLSLDFLINGREASISRDLKTERCSLVVGDEKIRKAKDIERKLYPFLGVSPRVLADIVFVMQGQIEGMLFQPPAERLKAFQHLFGTQNAERIRELLQDELTNLNVESREDQIKQFQRKLDTEILPPLKEAEDTIQTWKAFQLSKEKRGEIEKMLDLHRRASFSAERIKELQPAYDREDKDVADAEGKLRKDGEKLAEAEETLQAAKPAFEKARQIAQAADRAGELKGRRARLEDELSRLNATLQTPDPTCEFTADELDRARVDLSKAEIEYAHYAKLVEAGKGTLGKANHCPTCGQEITEEHVLEAKLKADRMSKPLSELRVAVKTIAEALEAYGEERSARGARRDAAAQRKEAVEKELSELPKPCELDDDKVQEARDVILQYESLENQADDIRSKMNVNRDTLKALRSLRDGRLNELNAMRAEIAKDPGAEAVAGAQEALENDTKAQLAIERAIGVRGTLSTQKASFEAQIAHWEAEEVKLARLRQWREHLENVRRLLHRDALPGEVARAYMDALNERLGYYLGLFGSPFTAEISSDATVVCRFTDKPEMPSERLSGGEKVILGVAFRFAVYDLFVADLGVMILDEPTVYLDDSNVGAVAELLQHLKGYSRSAGIQLIVVTHEQQLADSFDQVISINS